MTVTNWLDSFRKKEIKREIKEQKLKLNQNILESKEFKILNILNTMFDGFDALEKIDPNLFNPEAGSDDAIGARAHLGNMLTGVADGLHKAIEKAESKIEAIEGAEAENNANETPM